MKLLDVWREAGRTIKAEEDERLEVARLRVLRAIVLAAVAAGVYVFIGVVTTPPSDRIIWVFAGVLLLWVIGGVALWAIHHYRATTPELARATATRNVLMSPLVFTAAVLAAWLYGGDLGEAIFMGACATGGMILGAFATKRIAGRE